KMMERFMEWQKNTYKKSLDWCLENRWKVIIASTILFAGSLFLFKFAKTEFSPPQEINRLMVRIETKVGSSIDYTNMMFKEVEKVISKQQEVEAYFSNIGGDTVNTGQIMLTLKPPKQRAVDKKKKRPLSMQELMPVLRKNLRSLPGVEKVVIQDPSLMSLGGRRGFPIEFTLNGASWDKLAELSKQMAEEMEKSGVMVDVDSDYILGMPEVNVVPDRQKAALRGVSISVIGNTINALIGGVRSGKYSKGGRRYDIRVQLVEKDRRNVGDISKIWVRNNRGELVCLSDVISIVQKPTLLTITRKDRERAISMYSNLVLGKSQGEALKVIEVIGKKILPDGYKIVFSGSAKTFKESFSSLYVALILGIFVAYMVLGTQFNSFIHPFTVLIALPFSISGAVIAMIVTGQSLNIFSAIGVILLMGIVKKNSILLVDFTNQRRESGMSVTEALKNACPLRLRPIIMTSVSTIAAARPPALAIGPGAETRVPMAVVIIGGVLLSTLLTLFVVPCAYSLLSHFESRKHRKEVHEALEALAK
ncbi:MAG: efflux RND transporter permease subunit, partial [Elusimicrobiota bacterium]|nr:efflux RND transporter permease subunit [Elusimicrobiota bacterium]